MASVTKKNFGQSIQMHFNTVDVGIVNKNDAKKGMKIAIQRLNPLLNSGGHWCR
jgi:hypothetical protein